MDSYSIGFDFHYNARPFYDGARTYAESLVCAMDGLGGPFRWRLFTPEPAGAEELSLSDKFLPLKSPFAHNKLNLVAGYALACRRHNIDLFHSQYFRPMNLPAKVRTVVTVHDILYERMPQFFPWRLRTQMRFLLPGTVRQADCIIASSRFTKGELMELYGLPEEKIQVVPCGFDPIWECSPPAGKVEGFEGELGLRRPYALAIGRLAPIKNLPGMLHAVKELLGRGRDFMLVLVGGSDPSFPERELLGLRKELGLTEHVRLAGSLPRERLGLLMAGATMLWFPSFGEGFGIPAVEAMAAGLPVIVGNGGALPETVGDAAIVIDPAQPSELADATVKLLDNRTVREDLIKRGRERASQFTWRHAAERTLEVYRRLLGA